MAVEFLTIDGYQVQQHRDELDFICKKSKGKRNYMEIGVFNGGTFNHVSKHIKGKHIALDMAPWPERNENLKKTVKDCHIIIGDSHNYATKEQVRKVLDGELLDVLFIDGDHSALGVKRDYEMYKEFVADGGLIFFHDIIKSDFHAKHSCFVDQFWDSLPEQKESITVSEEWGGVGCIVNKKVNWKCYQIFFDENSKKHLLPIFTPYDNSLDKSNTFYENNVILDIYNKIRKEKAEYIGTTSWKFAEKTKMTATQFTERVEATNCCYQAILFPIQSHLHENCLERNKASISPLYKLSLIFDDLNILPFKMNDCKWTCSYCNYWLADKETLKKYCKTTLIPAIKAYSENQKIIDLCNQNKFFHNNRYYNLAPFFLEQLFGFFVNHFNIKHTIITEDRNSNFSYTPPVLSKNKEIKFVDIEFHHGKTLNSIILKNSL